MSTWHVVRTKSGKEDLAVWHLQNQGFEAYLPKYKKTVRHARKTKTVLKPLFPAYVFVNMDIDNQRWRSVNGTVGVVGLIQFGADPALLPDSVIEGIRDREQVDGSVSLAPSLLHKGDIVRIREGALADYTALLDEVCDEKRVILLLDLMGRNVRVHANAENLAKVS